MVAWAATPTTQIVGTALIGVDTGFIVYHEPGW